jgi:hypothetical protein
LKHDSSGSDVRLLTDEIQGDGVCSSVIGEARLPKANPQIAGHIDNHGFIRVKDLVHARTGRNPVPNE